MAMEFLVGFGIAPYIDFTVERFPDLLHLTAQHIRIVAWSLVLALPIGITLGTISALRSDVGPLIVWLAGIMMTIPSIALFGLLIPWLGIGAKPVIFSLILYSQLPLVRNTYVGLTGVDEAAIKVGQGMGMSLFDRLRYVQFPNALPVIMAGLRNAVVIIVGVAAVGAFIGAGGLGDFIFEGIRVRDIPMIVVTTIFLVGLTLILDYIFGVIEQILRLRNGEPVEKAIVTKVMLKVIA